MAVAATAVDAAAPAVPRRSSRRAAKGSHFTFDFPETPGGASLRHGAGGGTRARPEAAPMLDGDQGASEESSDGVAVDVTRGAMAGGLVRPSPAVLPLRHRPR